MIERFAFILVLFNDNQCVCGHASFHQYSIDNPDPLAQARGYLNFRILAFLSQRIIE